MYFIQSSQGQDLADAWDGSQQIQRVVSVLAGGFFNVPFELFQDLVERFDHGQIDLDAFANLRIIESFGHTVRVVFFGQLFGKCLQAVLGIGVLNMGHQFGTTA